MLLKTEKSSQKAQPYHIWKIIKVDLKYKQFVDCIELNKWLKFTTSSVWQNTVGFKLRLTYLVFKYIPIFIKKYNLLFVSACQIKH